MSSRGKRLSALILVTLSLALAAGARWARPGTAAAAEPEGPPPSASFTRFDSAITRHAQQLLDVHRY